LGALNRLLVVLAPLLLVAAGPGIEQPDRGRDEPPAPTARVMSVYEWLKILRAPATPKDFEPPAGPRVRWPLTGVITQPFGCTGFYLEKPAAACPSGFHTGVDIARPQGTPIRAAAGGLAYPFLDDERYGNHVLIQMQGGLAAVYGHMVRTNVGWGQPVNTGDVIGWVGSTGNSSGPHLHFEVRFAGVPYDPMQYLDGSPPNPGPLPAGWPGAPPDDTIGRR
jgi:murein DD-endopeptidase MepM/ murein hydrolase activator NlpD